MTDRQLSYHYRIEWAWGGWMVRWRDTAEVVAREGPTR